MTPSAQSFDTESSLLPIVSGISHKRLLHVFKYTFSGGQAVMPTPSFHTPSPFFLCCRLVGGREWPQKPCQAVHGGTPSLSPLPGSHTRAHVHPPTHPMHTRGVVRVGLLPRSALSLHWPSGGQAWPFIGPSRRRCEQYTSPRNARASADFMGYST